MGLDHAVIECGGVGYHFLATPSTLSLLRRGEEATVLTNLSVKEDAMTLYGFSVAEERAMFRQLQTVSGLGPKLAMACLSTLTPAELSKGIVDGASKTLQQIPGVGKRMAERMVVELKDKVDDYLPSQAAETAGVTPDLSTAAQDVAAQVTDALIGLGFTDRVATPVVDAIMGRDPSLDTETALRAALSELGRK